MYGGSTDSGSLSYDPALVQQLVIPFSADLRDMAPTPQALSHVLCPIGSGLPQPANCIKKYLGCTMPNSAINIRGHCLLQWRYLPQA